MFYRTKTKHTVTDTENMAVFLCDHLKSISMTSGIVLSDVQKRVINHDHGHLRIVACPGSGKTEVVSRRVAELIKKGVLSKNIIAFTFTEKAAESLKLRIRKILEEQCPGRSDFGDMYIGTIDAFCLYTIKQLKPEYRSFEMLDSARRTAFVDRWYYRMGLGDMQTKNTLKKWDTIRMFCDSVDRLITEAVDVSQISDHTFVKCYENYVKKLEEEKFFDFISIIRTLLNLLQYDKDALHQLNASVKHVVFDEYQDVNKLQEDLLGFLSKGAESVCVVGDDDQNIFQWRGSNIKHIIDFPNKYVKHGVTTEKLDINYRATDGLVDIANKLIEHNNTRVSKDMKAFDGQNRTFEYGDIVYNHFDTDKNEFDFILQTIHNLKNTDFIDKNGKNYALSYHDMAVIVRTNEDAARIISFLKQNDIPCIADSGSSVFDDPIVSLTTDCICYVFSSPGYTTETEIPELENLVQRYQSIVGKDTVKFSKNLKNVKRRADEIIRKEYSDWLPNLGLQEFFQRVLNAMGAESGIFNEADLYHLAVLSKVISDYEYVYQTLRAREVAGLKWFIRQFADAHYSDPTHNDPTLVDAIRVLTIWKAKGLEFPIVFVPSFVNTLKPYKNTYFVDDCLYERERYDGDIEDKRRAYYTAITRSQKYLFLTGARKRIIVVKSNPSKREIQPHPFIKELKNDRVSPLHYTQKPNSKYVPFVQSEGTFPTSYSAMSIYERCPYDYKLRNILGFNAGVPTAFGYGTNIHNIMNVIHSDFIRNKKVPTDDEIDGIFDKMFYMRFAPSSQNENMKKAGSKVVKNYVKLHKKDFGRILETEKRFEFVMGKALISGDIDLLKKTNKDGKIMEVEIIDFKTDKQREDGMYELDYSEQVQFYSYAARMSLGYRPEMAAIHHLDTDERDHVDISDKKLEETMRHIEDNVERITSRSFDATPETKKCTGCDFRALCHYKGFDVGVDFGPAKSGKRNTSMRKKDDIDIEKKSTESSFLEQSVVSSYMSNRAQKITAGSIIQNNDGSFIIQSGSDPDRSYTVTESTCQCMGFRNYSTHHPGSIPTCSHIEAVKILRGRRTK